MESKRLAIAFAVSAVILVGWTLVFPPPKPAGTVPPSVPATAVATRTALPATATPVLAVKAPQRPAEPVAPVMEEGAREFVVTGALYTVRLSNRGGELLAYTLSRFQDSKGEPLDLVRRGREFPGRTLALDRTDPFLTRAAQAYHAVEVEQGGPEARVRFRYREADGSEVVRTYAFGASYPIAVEVDRLQEGVPGPVGLVLGPGLGNPSPEELENRYTKPGSSVVLDGGRSVSRKAKDGLKEPMLLGKGVLAAGLEDNYFLSAFLPAGDAATTLRPVTLTGPPASPGGAPISEVESEVVLSGIGPLKAGLYFGPKDIAILESLRPGMDKLIDYGWFAILVKPLLLGLIWIHSFARNWGVAIILITFLIKILLFPLTYKQLVSMKKMSALQPKLEALRIKWAPKMKQDPQARVKMNEEMMSIYKQEGVNPTGGCLPLVLQMPILIAFYNLLAHAIELRHAPFMLWITDLSAKDPYYVTPILMTLTMWIQQQMMPATGDPATRRVMAFLPLVMGFMFKDMPSGLVLYWLIQNVLGIVQQLLLERYTDLGTRPKARKA